MSIFHCFHWLCFFSGSGCFATRNWYHFSGTGFWYHYPRGVIWHASRRNAYTVHVILTWKSLFLRIFIQLGCYILQKFHTVGNFLEISRYIGYTLEFTIYNFRLNFLAFFTAWLNTVIQNPQVLMKCKSKISKCKKNVTNCTITWRKCIFALT